MTKHLQKFTAILLAVIMTLGVFTVVPFTASAVGEIPRELQIGDFYVFLDDDGTLEIEKYIGTATELTIPSELDEYKVISIGDSAFYSCDRLTSVTISDSVTSIGYGAFMSCTSLTSITIPDSVTSIGNCAFYDCDGLTSVTIPDSVTYIGYSAFDCCTNLTNITIPDSVTSIGYGVFMSCTSLTSITIPNSVTIIGEKAFHECTSLTNITIPDSVTSIDYMAFGYYGNAFYPSKIENFTITGYKGTAAEKYANENRFKFIALDNALNPYPDSYINLYVHFLQEIHDNPQDYVTLIEDLNNGEVDFTDIEENDFSICDINQDGIDDLIVSFSNTYTVGMYTGVWTFDKNTNSVVQYAKLGVSCDFYNNGTVKVNASHNQSFGQEVWPYTLYHYDNNQHEYVSYANAYCVEKKYDYNEIEYSIDKDIDKDGVIYYFETDGQKESLTLEEYSLYVDKYIPESSKINLNWNKLNYDNIFALSDGNTIVNPSLGDIDGDGKISVNDVTDIQKYIVQLKPFTDEQIKFADVDKNGKIDVNDVTLLQKVIVKIAVI